jgi:hypothetical protein
MHREPPRNLLVQPQEKRATPSVHVWSFVGTLMKLPELESNAHSQWWPLNG